MEDEGIVNKKLIFFVGVILFAGLLLLIILLSGDTEKNRYTQTNNDVNEKPANDEINEEFFYGKYVNETDENSYLEISKDTYTYVMNVCEGYVTYKNDNEYSFSKNIASDNGTNTVTIKLSSLGKEAINMTFVGSSTGIINEFSTIYTCSGSNKYIRKALEN